MPIVRRQRLALVILAMALSWGPGGSALAAGWVFVKSGSPVRLDYSYAGGNQPGGQSAPALAANPYNGGFVATWLNYRSASNVRAFIHYLSASGFPGGTLTDMGAATGPTTGAVATSVAPVAFADGAMLVLFAADRRNASAANKKDIFAQALNPQRQKIGVPVGVNQVLANFQSQVFGSRLSNGRAITAFLSRGTAQSTFDIKGRTVAKNGVGVANEQFLTANTAGAQTPTSLAALTNGTAALAYVVRTTSASGVRQDVYVQRLNALGARLGNPTLLKQTLGANTYGGAGVAALSGGRFIAVWFVAGTSGTAVLKGKVFSAAGVPGTTFSIGTTRIRAAALTVPKVEAAADGNVVIVTEGFASNVHSLQAWLLGTANQRLTGPFTVASSSVLLSSMSLIDLANNRFFVSWTQTGASALANRIFAQQFYPNLCARC